MINLPTCEFVGLLNDVIAFALDDDDFPDLNCIRLGWDGEMLHAQAHDGWHVAWSRWHPDDDPEEPAQESITQPWGGFDDPWWTIISRADAKGLTTLYKVGDKQMFTPIALEMRDRRLRVVRDRAFRLMAITSTVDNQDVRFADIESVLAAAGPPQPVSNLSFNAGQLAHFDAVRPRGPVEMTFTGARGPALVQIGERFTGAITPVRPAAERQMQAAA